MKKLLAMYICVSALFYGFNANASNFDMPPLDNSHTQFSLVPESLFGNSSSYQIARTYFMPDYQRNLVGRVNNDGKDVDNRDCTRYGYVAFCEDEEDGTIVHPVTGLTCYKDCKAKDKSCNDYNMLSEADCPEHWQGAGDYKKIGDVWCYEFCLCDTSYYKYAEVNCRTQGKKAGGEKCNSSLEYNYKGVYEPDGYGDDWRYTKCECSDDYKFGVCPANGVCSSCGGKYKLDSCESGYSLDNGQCVKIENCNAYTLGSCPDGCNCSTCPDNSTKFKIDSAKTSDGWSWTAGQTTCSATACPAGYTAGVTECSDTNYSYSSNGKSGGKVCGKCVKNDTYTLPTRNYVKIAVNVPTDGSTLSFSLDGFGYVIDWGDGTHDSNNYHTYAKAGNYDVNLSEGIVSFLADGSDVKITKIYTLDMDTIKSAVFASNCDQLTGTIPNFPPSLESGDGMFFECKGLTGNIPPLPTSLKSGNMMFGACNGLSGNIPNLPAGLISGVGMFGECFGLTGKIPELPSSLKYGDRMFVSDEGLTGNIPSLPISLQIGDSMFQGCSGLTGNIPEFNELFNFNRGNMMFSGCTGLTGEIPDLNNTFLQEADYMFYGCTGLTGGIPNLPTCLGSAEAMFENCENLNGKMIEKLPGGLIKAPGMFAGCTKLTGSFPEIPELLRDGRSMFAECRGLKGGIPTGWSKYFYYGDYMFKNCVGLTGEIPELGLPVNLETGAGMFQGCSNLKGLVPMPPTRLEKCKDIFQGTSIDMVTPVYRDLPVSGRTNITKQWEMFCS